MEQLIEYIAKSLVDDPSQVQVRRRNSGSTIILELHVAQQDAGRVIGRIGRIANAIRSLLYVSGDRGARVILKIV